MPRPEAGTWWRFTSELLVDLTRRLGGASRLLLVSLSASWVRRMRCGMPSSTEVTTVSFTVRLRYSALTLSGTRLSLVSRNRVPMAMPAAP